MVVLKSLGWGVALAVAGLGLGLLYSTVFPSGSGGGLEELVPMVYGLVVGGVTGVVASATAALWERRGSRDSRALALAVVAPPIVLILLGSVLHVLSFGIDLLPVTLAVGLLAGVSTGATWALARQHRMRATPVGSLVTLVALMAVAWLAGTILGFRTGDGATLAPALFFYLAMILPLQFAAPVSSVMTPKGRVASAI